MSLVCWVGLVWGLASMPGSLHPQPRSKAVDAVLHLCAHVSLHAALMYLAWRAAETLWSRPLAMRVAVAFSLFNAIAGEVYQCWVPQRHADVLQVALNVAGVLFAAWLIRRRLLPEAPSGVSVE